MRLHCFYATLLALTLSLSACASDSSTTGTLPPGTGGTPDTAGSGAADDTGAQAQTDPGPPADLAALDPGTASTDPGATSNDPGTASADPGTAGTDPGPAATDPGSAGADPGQTERATWENGIGDLFDKNCAGCHGFASSYAGVASKISSITSKIRGGHKVSGADKEAMLDWIDDGYPENWSGVICRARAPRRGRCQRR